MHLIDWLILAIPVAVVFGIAIYTRRYMKSVADFLAAGRSAGRYLVTISEGMAGMGLITAVALFEVSYKAGPAFSWWSNLTVPVLLIMSLTGFVIYRYRQTRVLTMAQFFEVRYSRRLRIFMGILCYLSGLINYGIFPAVGARFFIYFCGLPEQVELLGAHVSVFALLMAIFLGMALWLVWQGGQLQILVTDAVQGLICGVMILVVAYVLLGSFSFDQLYRGMAGRPAGESLLNPFDTGQMKDFNIWYILIGCIGTVYIYMSWQGNQGFNASALNPHEAKMGKVISGWRTLTQTLMMALLAYAAIAYLRNAEFAGGARAVNEALDRIENPAIRTQMLVPVALAHILPVGVLGMFAAIMFFWMLTTDTSYLHSWGSIFIQDVVMPLRRKELTPEQHIRWLRWSIVSVAVFAFLFSLFYRQTTYIVMFFALTGAIFLGGSGAVIIGGLYWSRGTTAAAWSAMLTGSTLATAGILLDQPVLWAKVPGLLVALGVPESLAARLPPKFPVNGAVTWFIAYCTASLTYGVVSLLTCRERFDMDRLLHRGRYAVKDDEVAVKPEARGMARWKEVLLGWDEEFTRGDKTLSVLFFAYSMFWFVAFLVITAINLAWHWPERWWWNWGLVQIWMCIVLGPLTTIWFTWGGVRDLIRLFRRLRGKTADVRDDGRVSGHHLLADEPQ